VAAIAGLPNFARVLARCFAIQAAWNYERMLGTGFGWAIEPSLRPLADGTAEGERRYRAAVARQSGFFNSHPFMAGLALGAAARAEHDGEAPEKIVRLRDALCGPLGSVGDRLFWAAWLPCCAAVALALAAFGAGAWAAAAFLALFNVAHVYCRWWSLRAGWSRGLNVAAALSTPTLRLAARWAGPAAALALGFALPVAFAGQLRGAGSATWFAAVAGVAVFAVVVRLLRRVSGVALAVLLLGTTWLAGFLWR
jgi:PTS system mannose-specific IID component